MTGAFIASGETGSVVGSVSFPFLCGWLLVLLVFMWWEMLAPVLNLALGCPDETGEAVVPSTPQVLGSASS